MSSDSSPTISFACPSCNAVLEAPSNIAGQVIQCPECQAAMEVPAPEPEVSAPATRSGGKKTVIKRGGASASRSGRPSGVRTPPKKGGGTRNRHSPAAVPPTVKKPKKSPVGKIMLALLLIAGLGAGGWYAFTQTGGGSGSGGRSLLARATGGGRSVIASGPMGPQTQPPNASRWQLGNRPEVTAFQWGGSGREQIFDMISRQNGNMIISGLLPNREGIPNVSRRHHLLDDQGSENFGFLAEFSADGSDMLWFSTFGGDLVRPEVLALGPDGTIAVGGRVMDRGQNHPGIEGEFSGRRAVIGVVAADGSEVLWMNEGGPNQNQIGGVAVDQDGRVYWVTGARGQGQRAYVLRRNADGSDSPFPKAALGGTERWAINFDVRDEEFRQPGQIGAFYEKGVGEAYHYDGPDGWGAVRWWLHGIRQGGSIVFLPDGDFVVAGTLQYDFVKGRDRRFPAFDLIMARYNQDGELLWSTNLYQEGDSVHTPDQKDHHLIYNPVNGDLYILAIQHGSNVYRFMGELLGDTGNLMIGWVGQVNPENGDLRNGWYWQSNRNGQYNERGSPRSPPHPRLSGNRPRRLAVDSEGRIYIAGTASPRMFTTGNAWRDWPEAQGGGGNPGIVILSPNLDRYEFASTLRGDDYDKGTARSVIVNDHGVWVAGENGTRNFPTGPQPPWANANPAGERDKFMVNLRFH